MSALDDRIDDLYQGPLADFTASRNALAKSLASDERARVKALEKPTVVAWAVNQLYWKARKTYDRLLDRGVRLRKAQIAALSGKGSAEDLRGATEAHRSALAEAAREAGRVAGVGPQHIEPLARTLETLSLAAEPPERHGRLTDVLQPAGFEALSGVKPQIRPQLAPKLAAKAAEAREAERRKHETAIAEAESALERARDAVAFAKQTLDRATRAYDEAEARLKRTREG